MEIFYERRYYAFWKGVITPFWKACLRLSERRYYAFLMHKRRNNAFPLRVITPFSRYFKRRFYAFYLFFFSTQFDTNRLSYIFNKYKDWENFNMTTTIVSDHHFTCFPVNLEYE